MTLHTGACHCGAVTFTLSADIDSVYTCDCSMCRRKGAVMTKQPATALEITGGKDALSLYQWNAKIAEHWFCSTCGIHPFHRMRSAPDHFAINVRCIDGFDWTALPMGQGRGGELSLVNDQATS